MQKQTIEIHPTHTWVDYDGGIDFACADCPTKPWHAAAGMPCPAAREVR